MKRNYLTKGSAKAKNRIVTVLMALTMSVSVVGLLQSCKEDPPVVEKNNPEITSVNPVSAEVGGSVTITGKYFAKVAGDNIVKIGGEIAHVTSGNESSLQVTVPDEVAVGPTTVVVIANGLTSNSYTGFSVSETLPELVINTYTEEGSYGDLISITGSGFGTDKSKITVTINGVIQDSALTLQDDKITFILKEKTFSGDFVINRAGTKRTLCAFVYHVLFEVEEFTSETGARWMEIDRATGNLFVVYNDYAGYNLFKLDKNGDLTDTLIYHAEGVAPTGLFLNSEGVLYINDVFGRMLYLPHNSTVVDTLIKKGVDPNIKQDRLWDLTGDNSGSLYMTTLDKSIIKLNPDTKLTDILSATSEATYDIVYYNNSLFVATSFSIFKYKADGSGYDEFYSPGDGSSFNKSQLFFHENLGLLGTNIIENGDLCIIENNKGVQVVSPADMNIGDYSYSIVQTSDKNLLVGGREKIVKIYIR